MDVSILSLPPNITLPSSQNLTPHTPLPPLSIIPSPLLNNIPPPLPPPLFRYLQGPCVCGCPTLILSTHPPPSSPPSSPSTPQVNDPPYILPLDLYITPSTYYPSRRTPLWCTLSTHLLLYPLFTRSILYPLLTHNPLFLLPYQPFQPPSSCYRPSYSKRLHRGQRRCNQTNHGQVLQRLRSKRTPPGD